jgi:hypothetical protein
MFSINPDARETKILQGQAVFLDRLLRALAATDD